MIIFGQGGVRCHPHILDEVRAIQAGDKDNFDKHLIAHIGFFLSNLVRSFFLGITDGIFVQVPIEKTKRYYQKITRLSSAFAYIADVSMILLGGKLKFKESLSARLGDILSMLYMASSVLKRYEDEGRKTNMEPIVDWSLQYPLNKAQKA